VIGLTDHIAVYVSVYIQINRLWFSNAAHEGSVCVRSFIEGVHFPSHG
jgi:hypothetical protein